MRKLGVTNFSRSRCALRASKPLNSPWKALASASRISSSTTKMSCATSMEISTRARRRSAPMSETSLAHLHWRNGGATMTSSYENHLSAIAQTYLPVALPPTCRMPENRAKSARRAKPDDSIPRERRRLQRSRSTRIGFLPVIQPRLPLRRMRLERLLVRRDAPAGRVGHHQMAVLDPRRRVEQLVVPGRRSMSISMMRRFGTAAAKCAFIMVQRWP